MSYRLCKIPFGTSKVEKLFDLNIDLTITHVLHIEGLGFLFLFRNSHCIGLVDNLGKMQLPWMGDMNIRGNKDGTRPLFDFPSSICYYSPMKTCYLLERGGSNLRTIDLSSKHVNSALGQNDRAIIQKFFSKIDNPDLMETSCDLDQQGNLYWSIKDLHRCLKMDREYGGISNYVGNGLSQFSSASKLGSCSLSKPSGIRFAKEGLYIADSGNHCVRRVFENTISIACGHPINLIMKNPTQIIHSKGIIYIKDEDDIHYFSFSDRGEGLLFTIPNLVAIESNSKRDLIVVEKT